MAEEEGDLRVAEVPSLGRPIKGDNDFVALNKMLRACFVCRLVKTERQVGGAAMVSRVLPRARCSAASQRRSAQRPQSSCRCARCGA